MSTKEIFALKNRMLLTTLATLGWFLLMLCWIAFAWSHYSFFQNLAGLGIATLLFATIVGTLWVVEQGFTLAATILTTLGWPSFVLYWMGFAWSWHTLLQNFAILTFSLVTCGGILVVLWLREPFTQRC